MIVSVRGDVPISPVLHATYKEVAMIPLVADRPVQRTVSGRSVGTLRRVRSPLCLGSMCFRPIRMYVYTANTYIMRMCLLYPDAGDLRSGSVDSQRLDHWCTVI